MKLQYDNRTILVPNRDAYIGYTDNGQAYSRYMWSFSGVSGGYGGYIFQMEDLAINNISGFSYVTASPSTGFTNQGPEKMIDGNTATKWCMNCSTEQECYLIFDSTDPIVPTSYSLQIGGDTQIYTGRNPKTRALWASTGTPTTFNDPSWELLNISDSAIPTTNYAWVTMWEK